MFEGLKSYTTVVFYDREIIDKVIVVLIYYQLNGLFFSQSYENGSITLAFV